ncbi:hypothetical protein [Fulvimarina sp. MAC3]|uniref:hypothetical protein n=1 Tax=Fulvimarina sp. MAC3 TaxID=3148887 RepID=UPI0031FCE806
MTAINIIVATTKAFVLTDSAFYRPSGEVVEFGRKCVVAQGARLAVATRGDYRLAPAIAEACDDLYDSIDDLIEEEAHSLRGLYERTIQAAGAVDASAQMLFVGWSAHKGGPVAVSLLYDGTEWTFDDRSEEGAVAPMPDATEMSRLRMLRAEPGEDYDAETFDPIAHGIPLIEGQRRMKLKNPTLPGSAKFHCVGGDVLLTTVTEVAIEQATVHSWPDTVGCPIRPEPFALPVTEGMSRQQRRALARQARKVAA